MSIYVQDAGALHAGPFTSLTVVGSDGFTVRHYLAQDGSLLDIVKPENLNFTLNKKSPHTINYEYSHQQGVYHDFVGAYRTDFELRWGTTTIMRGMHVPAPETAKGTGFSTIYGKDWSHYLEKRHYPFDPLNPNTYRVPGVPAGYAMYYGAVDAVVIIKSLLDTVLSMPYSLNMTYPTLTTHIGLPIDFQLALADTTDVLSFISSFSDIFPGFDYEVLHTKEFRIYSPHKYDPLVVGDSSKANYIFDSSNPELITEGPRYINNGPAATHWLGVGSGIGATRLGSALGYVPAQQVYRRLDGTADYSVVKKLSDLQLRAKSDFSFALNPQHEITFTVQAEHIANFWTLFTPGSAIWLDSELTSHRIQSAQEIVQMDCTADNHGGCTVNFGLNQIYAGTAGVAQA